MSALAEPLDPSNTVAAQERVDLRRSLLQLLQTVGQVLSQDILVALGSDAGNVSPIHQSWNLTSLSFIHLSPNSYL